MLSRISFKPLRDFIPPFTSKVPEGWREAYDQQRAENESIRRELQELKRAVREHFDALNKPGALTISAANIDASKIGASSASTGRFTTLGVGQAPPTTTDYVATLGSGSGRQFIQLDGGSSGANGGPGLIFTFGSSLTGALGIGGYSSLVGGAYDARLTLYGGAKDIVIDTGDTAKQIDFLHPTSGAGASAGTLANAPSAGDPSYWLKVKIGGNVRYIPAWS